MAGFLREHSLPIAFSVLLHGVLVAALLLTTLVSFKHAPPTVQPLPIDAVVIDSQVLRAAQKVQSDRVEQEAARLRTAAEAKAAADAKAATDAQAVIDAQNAEQQRADEVKRAAVATEAEAKHQSDMKHAEEVKRADDATRAEAAKRAEDAKRADEAKRLEAAQRVEDAKRIEETKRAEELKRADVLKRAADQKEKSEREAELKRQLADEEHASAVQSGPLRDQYMARLQSRIQSAWIRPPSAGVGLDCLVEVTQVPGGVVTAVRVTQCNGDTAARQSIENAVYRASPLPSPGDPALFSRLFSFHFHPDQ